MCFLRKFRASDVVIRFSMHGPAGWFLIPAQNSLPRSDPSQIQGMSTPCKDGHRERLRIGPFFFKTSAIAILDERSLSRPWSCGCRIGQTGGGSSILCSQGTILA